MIKIKMIFFGYNFINIDKLKKNNLRKKRAASWYSLGLALFYRIFYSTNQYRYRNVFLSLNFFMNSSENSNFFLTFCLIGGGLLGVSLAGWGLKTYFLRKIDNSIQITHLSKEYAQGFSYQKIIFPKPLTSSIVRVPLEFKKENSSEFKPFLNSEEFLPFFEMAIMSDDFNYSQKAYMQQQVDHKVLEEFLENQKVNILGIINHLKMKKYNAEDILEKFFSEVDLASLSPEKKKEFCYKLQSFSCDFAYYLKSYVQKNKDLEFLLHKKTYEFGNPINTFLYDFIERIYQKHNIKEDFLSKEETKNYFLQGFFEGIEQKDIDIVSFQSMTFAEQIHSMGCIFPSLIKTVIGGLESSFSSAMSDGGKEDQEMIFLFVVDQLISILQK